MIFPLLINSQNKKINVFVFFSILVFPIISSPSLEELINFKSNEIVTQGALSADLCAEVPAPASIRAAKYPP